MTHKKPLTGKTTIEVFKKIYYSFKDSDGYKRTSRAIATLHVAPNALRRMQHGCSLFESRERRKCRSSSAKVISIQSVLGGTQNEGFSVHDPNFLYVVGQTVRVRNFDKSSKVCAPGIHWFLSRADALAYLI